MLLLLLLLLVFMVMLFRLLSCMRLRRHVLLLFPLQLTFLLDFMLVWLCRPFLLSYL